MTFHDNSQSFFSSWMNRHRVSIHKAPGLLYQFWEPLRIKVRLSYARKYMIIVFNYMLFMPSLAFRIHQVCIFVFKYFPLALTVLLCITVALRRASAGLCTFVLFSNSLFKQLSIPRFSTDYYSWRRVARQFTLATSATTPPPSSNISRGMVLGIAFPTKIRMTNFPYWRMLFFHDSI